MALDLFDGLCTIASRNASERSYGRSGKAIPDNVTATLLALRLRRPVLLQDGPELVDRHVHGRGELLGVLRHLLFRRRAALAARRRADFLKGRTHAIDRDAKILRDLVEGRSAALTLPGGAAEQAASRKRAVALRESNRRDGGESERNRAAAEQLVVQYPTPCLTGRGTAGAGSSSPRNLRVQT